MPTCRRVRGLSSVQVARVWLVVEVDEKSKNGWRTQLVCPSV